MNCRNVHRLADEYLDNLLSPRRSSRFEAHLDACPDCSRVLQETAAVRSRIAALPRSFAPEHELWGDIRARIGERRIQRAPILRARQLLPLGAAACALAVLLFAFFALRSPGGTLRTARPAVIGTNHPAVSLAAFRTIDADYRRARDTLLAALSGSMNGIDPGLIELVKTNLATIDRAVEEIESALGKYPDESELLLLLAAANSRRLDVLAAAHRQLMDL